MGKVLTIVFLLALNGFFVAAEFALVRARRTRLEAMHQRGDPLAKIALRAVDNLGRMLSASQLGITLASLGLGAVAEEALGHVFDAWLGALPVGFAVTTRASIALGIALTVATYLHVVIGELFPRAVALNHPERFATWLAPPLFVFVALMTPLIWLFDKSSRLLLRLARQNVDVREEQVHEPDEIRLIVRQSEEEGKIERENAQLLGAVFEFTEKKARDVMTPRTRMVGLPASASLEDTLAIVQETEFSRYPVFDQTLDDIIGVLLSKDLIPSLRAAPAVSGFDVRAVMRPVHFVPGSRDVEAVLSDFKRRKEHLAIVLDEFGGTAGLVTMEDLLEELVGEILDEHDEVAAAGRRAPGETIVDGSMSIADFNERHGYAVPDEEYSTIGGYVFGTLGRLPAVGDGAKAGGAYFTVRTMDGRRIAELTVRKAD